MEAATNTLACQHCGKLFEKSVQHHKYCCARCRWDAWFIRKVVDRMRAGARRDSKEGGGA